MDDIKIFNENPFYILLIEPGKISHLDWNNPDYVQTLSNMPFVKSFSVEPNKFFDKLHELLKMNEESDKTHLVTEVISEQPGCVYELIFIDTLNKTTKLAHNELASLLNLNEEKVNGNAIIVKTDTPTLTDDMIFTDMTSSELYKVLYERGFGTIVSWDEEWREENIYGDMETYAKRFFEGESFKKMEIAFLKHNLNIWYLSSEYGTKDVCGDLITSKIEKCFVFTMLTETIRSNITKDELLKIFALSKVLEIPYTLESKWHDEEVDKHGRKIIKNKYKVLDNVYQEKILNLLK